MIFKLDYRLNPRLQDLKSLFTEGIYEIELLIFGQMNFDELNPFLRQFIQVAHL